MSLCEIFSHLILYIFYVSIILYLEIHFFFSYFFAYRVYFSRLFNRKSVNNGDTFLWNSLRSRETWRAINLIKENFERKNGVDFFSILHFITFFTFITLKKRFIVYWKFQNIYHEYRFQGMKNNRSVKYFWLLFFSLLSRVHWYYYTEVLPRNRFIEMNDLSFRKFDTLKTRSRQPA